MKQTNIELIRLMATNDLKHADIAKILKVSVSAVRGWTCRDDSNRYRNLDEIKLMHLSNRINSNNLRVKNRKAEKV